MGTTKEPAVLQRFRRTAAIFLLGNALVALTYAQDITTAPPPPRPKTSLDLSNLGYEPSSRMTRLVYKGTVFLGFVDANHILFTFDRRRLFQRAHDCPPTHDDWLAHAAIMEVPSGKIVKETDWYLHDRRRYLWPLQSGQFLLRRLNSLYLVDQNLETKPLLTSDRDLLWVSVTPDRQQIIVETPAPPESGQTQKTRKTAFRVDIMDSTTLASERTFELGVPVALEGTSNGYPDVVHQNALWMIRFGPNPSARHNIARVRTLVQPLVFFSSNHSMVIGRCPKLPCQFSMTSFTTGGKRLWRQHWKRERHFPAVSHSESNSRFAVSTLTVADQPVRPAEPKPNDIPTDFNNVEGLEQCVDVLETASGTPVLSVTLSPPVVSGQNVALSPDGSRLAVVNGTALEVYDLPPATVEELAQFTAIKADAPGLYFTASKSDTSTNAQEMPDDPSTSAPTEDPAEASKSSYAPDRQPATDTTRSSTGSKIPLDIPSLRATSRAVLLDIVVINNKGQPVTGLSEKDFEVVEDGKPQSLESFNEVTSHFSPPETSPPVSNQKKSPNVFTNTIRSSPTRAINLVLLDLLNTPVSDQVYARQQLLRYLKNKPKDAQFALAVLSPGVGASLRLVQGFTADENTLMAAANARAALPKKAGWEASQSEALASTQSMVELARNDSHNNNNWAGVLQSMQEMQAQVESANTDERVGTTLESLSHLARYLSGYPGRKSLIWLSGSFPMALSPGAASSLGITENRNYFAKVRQATNLFAEGQVAVYPVDVRGLIATGTSALGNDFAGSAPIQQRQGLGRSTSPNIRVPGSNRDFTPNLGGILQGNEAASIPEDHNTMNQFASDTGGQAFFNTNAIEKAVAVATEQGSNYYSLSYSPTNKNYNGKFRKINVATADRGYHLHYRRGYYATDDSSRLVTGDASSGIGSAAMQHGSPLTAQVHFAVRVVPVGQKRKVEANPDKGNRSKRTPVIEEVQHYGVDYAIDSSDLRFLAGKEGQRLELGIEVATFADNGRLLNSVSGIWSNDLKPSTLKDIVAGGVRLHQEIDVPLQAACLRLGVQDRTSSHLGTIELPLPVPAPPDIPRFKRSLPQVEPD